MEFMTFSVAPRTIFSEGGRGERIFTIFHRIPLTRKAISRINCERDDDGCLCDQREMFVSGDARIPDTRLFKLRALRPALVPNSNIVACAQSRKLFHG